MEKFLYFDTNIYAFIASLGESKKIRKYLDEKGYKVKVSSTNIYEIYAIPDNKKRITELKTLIDIASIFDKKPESWFDAEELKKEMRRCRPDWMRKIIFDKKVKFFLDAHADIWKNVKLLNLLPANAYAAYHRDSEFGIKIHNNFQKAYRKAKVEDELQNLGFGVFNSSRKLVAKGNIDLADPEVFWRIEGLMSWHYALVFNHQSSRDYADWLAPYVKTTQLVGESYFNFWIDEIEARNVPRNRIIGLVNYYQTEHKIAHGNSSDQTHSTRLLDSDFIFTADKPFHKVLTKVVRNHYPNYSQPILLNRAASSAFNEISEALEQVY